MWRGIGPNVARNAIVNAAELATYDQVGLTAEGSGTGFCAKPSCHAAHLSSCQQQAAVKRQHAEPAGCEAREVPMHTCHARQPCTAVIRPDRPACCR